MAQLLTKTPKVKFSKPIEVNWDNFRRGLNTLLDETEIQGDELAQADNLRLIGKGIPTKRWGTKNYFLAGATGSIRGLTGYYTSSGGNELVVVGDDGLFNVKSNASYITRTGVSWASGSDIDMTQLDDSIYVVSNNRELVRYSTPTLYSFPTVAIPSNVLLSQLSSATGDTTFAYRVSSLSSVGETTASVSKAITGQPQDLADGSVRVFWDAVSTASGVLQGYNVYGRDEGDERFLATVGAGTTQWTDDGDTIPSEWTYPPTADSTGGIKAKYIERYQDRLVYAGVDGEPSKVVFSGRVPNQERNDVSYGGNFIRIEPDAGDNITNIKIFRDKIIVFKERSIWQITLSTASVGNFTVTIPNVQLLTSSHGCIAPKSVTAVENDMFLLTRRGVYALGDEPNILNVLRTNEVSAKIRPFFRNLTPTQLSSATAFYFNFVYGIFFPGKNQGVIYDRERLAWLGPWTRDSNVFDVYYDSSNNEKLLSGSDDSPYVIEYSSDYLDDNNSAFATILKTRKEDFDDWTAFKTIRDIFFRFRNVSGDISVSVRLENRNGSIVTAKSFTVTSVSANSGWGADVWANTLFGDSEESGSSVDINDLVKWIILNKAARTIQYEVKTNNRRDNYELLAIKSEARPISRGFNPSSWKKV